LGSNPGIYIYGMSRHIAVSHQDIEMAQVYERGFQDIIDHENEQYFSTLAEGPAKMQGASVWV
jgi:hypothetical protein